MAALPMDSALETWHTFKLGQADGTTILKRTLNPQRLLLPFKKKANLTTAAERISSTTFLLDGLHL